MTLVTPWSFLKHWLGQTFVWRMFLYTQGVVWQPPNLPNRMESTRFPPLPRKYQKHYAIIHNKQAQIYKSQFYNLRWKTFQWPCGLTTGKAVIFPNQRYDFSPVKVCQSFTSPLLLLVELIQTLPSVPLCVCSLFNELHKQPTHKWDSENPMFHIKDTTN